MPPFLSSYTLQVVGLISSAFILNSCASLQDTAPPLRPDSRISASLPSPLTEPALPLIAAESEQCLTEELDILRRTGTWQPVNDYLPATTTQESTPYDFPIVINKQVQAYLELFQNRQKRTFRHWLERSGRYVPMLQKELRNAGLPEDLAYLAMIESGFNQRAYSRAKAVGLWQFIQGTGRQYNLEIDKYVDERRHALKSTKAAVAFLADLYADFGDWHLAVAGYNAGAGKIRRGLKKYKTDDFWSLAQHRYLRLETKRYVPKLIAAILIAKNPARYGFMDINYDAPLEYETLRVGPGLSLKAIGLISNSDHREIKRLNQELKTGRTPLNKRSYDIQIPVGSLALAKTNLPRLHSVVSTGYKSHTIRKGETVSQIGRRYNINRTTLLKTNHLRSDTLVGITRLLIPYSTIIYRLLPTDGSKIAAADLILHTIKPGESISKIAAIYHVPAALIVSWNGLKNIHKIRAGQQLALYIKDAGRQQPTIPTASIQRDQLSLITLKGQKKLAMAAPKKMTPNSHWYLVRQGDSLWAISRMFNLSTKELKSLNNLKSNRIHPGRKLRIKNV